MTKTTTHTTNRTKQPTPAPCPEWCGKHTVGDHGRTVIHEGASASVDTLDAEYFVKPVLYSGKDSATTEITFDVHEHAELNRATSLLLGMTIAEAQLLINALLDAVNQTLPLEQQTFLGPPGFEYVPYDGPWA
jgi:predicted GTPase